MIDPRFAHAGAVPFASGYGVQPIPFQQQRHHHHHHRHRKINQTGTGESPVSRDESIHKVDQTRPPHQPNDNIPFGTSGGYGVPYGVGGFYGQQHQSFPGANFGFSSQYQGNVYDQGQLSGAVSGGKHRRRHHRHHRQATEATNETSATEQAQGVPEQLIGQRSSSVLDSGPPKATSSPVPVQDQMKGEQGTHRRHRNHRRHKHNGENGNFGQFYQSHRSAGADGYGHINDDLIFIERGEHSPHRQEPPPGYEYKGKIEVQNVDREQRSRSQGRSTVIPPIQPSMPIVQPSVPIAQPAGPCPPGWQQIILSAAPGGPCPPGTTMYTGQLAGPAGVAQAGLGGIGGFGGVAGGIGFGGVGPIGAPGSGGGLDSLAASLPFPPQGQLVADYIVQGTDNAAGSSVEHSQGAAGSYDEHHHGEQTEGNVSSRPTVIEVWQKRGKSEGREKSRSRSRTRSPKPGRPFDFDRFRRDILGAIERMAQNSGSGTRIQWTGHDGGTQTQIHPGVGYENKKEIEKKTTGAGEVRVIVQPIQPVFYMPRQTTEKSSSMTNIHAGPGIQQVQGGSNVVYVPRNVYVPVIKPVFVPRERVIVRPQVIHVARPVLVDRPVPVTQRPIIIDRERPVPVPVRGSANQGVAQTTSSRNTKEEYVYQDNLPVAYNNTVAETTSAANYDYMPTQQQGHQYATTSTHEVASNYQTQGPTINVTVPEQFQHSHSSSHINVEQNAGNYHELYSNIARTSSASGIDVTPLHCAPPIEILDAAVNPSWQRTDKSNLVRLYGRPAYELVQRTDQVEQQMYQELRHRNSSGGVQRSESVASYGSGAGLIGHSAGFGVNNGSFSTHTSNIQSINTEMFSHHDQGSEPICVNY